MTWRRRRRAGFRDVGFYVAAVPSYYGGLMTLGWASDALALRAVSLATLRRRFAAARLKTKYYTPDLHRAAFALPAFIQAELR
jgi:spermidine synthase